MSTVYAQNPNTGEVRAYEIDINDLYHHQGIGGDPRSYTNDELWNYLTAKNIAPLEGVEIPQQVLRTI